MRFRFVLSHAILGSLEVSEFDGWKDATLKLERHEEFHSLIEYFDGSFILYGNNGIVNGGIDFVKEIEQSFGLDETIVVDIDLTFDEISFSNVFNGQFKLSDLEEMPNNKMRIPIIRDDFWSKFIARLDTPVDLKSYLDLDDGNVTSTENIILNLPSQIIKYTTRGSVLNSLIYGAFEVGDNYMQFDWDTYTIDEVLNKYTYPISFNSELPFELYSVEYAGEYYFKIKIYLTHAGVIIGGGGSVTWDGYYDLTRTGPDIEIQFLINNVVYATFVQTDHGTDGVDGYSEFTYETTITLNAKDQVTIAGSVITTTLFFPMLLGSDVSDTGQIITEQILTGGPAAPNFPEGLTEDNELTVIALTTFPETQSESFLIHDVAAAICDRIIGQENTFYSDLLGSWFTRARQYDIDGCAWNYGLIKGLQLRQYALSEKPFFQSFNQFWKGINPILNLSLAYETVQIPSYITSSPETNLVEDLSTWENATGTYPGTWNFVLFNRPFESVNGDVTPNGYAAGSMATVAGTAYTFDTIINVSPETPSPPDVTIIWGILDASFNEIITKTFNYFGSGDKIETFTLTPELDGVYFGVRVINNTESFTKNFDVTYVSGVTPTVVYDEETVIRIEEKTHQYDDSNGTSVDFSNIRTITRKYDNDRIFNKVEIGYTRWQSEDISGIDDPQSKKTYSTRFQKVGKGIQLYSEYMAASLVIEQARRTTKEKSADYKYDNETFIIAVNPTHQDESPDTSPDLLHFVPELDENFSSITNLLNPETRYNLKLTPARNFLRWQNFLQGALQPYIGSEFKFASGEGNYDMTSTMDVNECLNEDYDGANLDEKGNIPVSSDFIHLPHLYEAEIPMEWSDYVLIRDNRRKPIGISLSTTDHIPMFIKTLEFKPVKGSATILMWAKEYLDLAVFPDTTPMQECQVPSDDCLNALTDSLGNILTNELGVCITE